MSLDLYSHYFTILRILAALPYFILSILIMRRRSDRLMAVFFAIVLCLFGSAGTLYNPLWEWIPDNYPWHPALNLLLSTLLFCSVIILYTFPDGRFVPGWTRWLALGLVPYAAAITFLPDESMLNPSTWFGPLAFLPTVVFVGSGVYAVAYRYRQKAGAVQKQQLKWFVAGALLIVLSWFIDYAVWEIYPNLSGDFLIQPGRPAVLWELFQDTAWYLAEFGFVVCIAISVFRYRLWDIDLVINRVLVYGSLTALTMLVYLGAVSGLGSLFRSLPDQTAFFLATGLVAILFEPFRQRLQRGVNRLMYGERDDPYAVLTRLSSALESTPNPADVLAALTAQIGQTLKIPYVAIYLQQDNEEKLGAAYGVAQEDLLSLPLVYQEERIGSLQAARRAPGESFSGPDLRLLENIARQAGPAVQSVKLHQQLMHSRAQIVSEREEERRRIRRDLHDELGPILASQSLKLVAASRMVDATPEQAKAMLDELAQQSQQTVVEIRRLVHGLRPPALDQLGLIEAIRDFGRSSGEPNGHSMVVEISPPAEGLPELPAAVGVHAYRLVLEALANATRHGHARLCTVKFYLEPGDTPGAHPTVLVIQICDDGRGLPEHYRAGVGLRSMRERAEEIGGTFKIEPTSPRGTTVTVRLPLSP